MEEINPKTGKRKKQLRYVPKKNALSKLLKTEPQKFFLDQDGRLYGIVRDTENPIFQELLDRGEIEVTEEQEGNQLLFVWIPQLLKGAFSKEKRRRESTMPASNYLPDEVLEMPEPENPITLYLYQENTVPCMNIVISDYPERNPRNAKTALIQCFVRKIEYKKT